MARSMAHQANRLTKRAAAGAEDVTERARELAQQAASLVEEAANTLADARETAWDVAQRTGAQARVMADQAYRNGQRGARELAQRVEERPLMALLLAGALGYALAYLLHARR
jgi:ElaB/YqjD/DUF883 family membrane-anchored ribosome-binding protein